MYIKSFLIASFLFFLGGNYLTAQDYEYVGAAKCKMCHNKTSTGAQYKIWAQSKHAKAMESLNAVEKKDPKCIKCHSTAGSVNKDMLAGLKMSEGVSCESCHGPGSGYKSYSVMRNHKKSLAKGLIMPTKEVCIRCHNTKSKHYKKFNYDEYVKKIAHPVPSIK